MPTVKVEKGIHCDHFHEIVGPLYWDFFDKNDRLKVNLTITISIKRDYKFRALEKKSDFKEEIKNLSRKL